MAMIQTFLFFVFVFIGPSFTENSVPSLCYQQYDNTTSTNAYLGERFIFPIYLNYSTAQRDVPDNTSGWTLNLVSLYIASGGPNEPKSGSFDAFLNSTTNGSSYILGASYAPADFHIRITPDYGWLTIKDLSFPGYVSNNTEFSMPQNVSYNISVSYAEFRTKKPPDTLHTSTYTLNEVGSNCTRVGKSDEGSNTITQYKPFVIELKFYDGRRLWFNIPLSLNYLASYSRSRIAEFYVNCPDCFDV